MSASTGYVFPPNTLARSSQVNENFEWFRGHYLPITQSGTWANTTGVMNIGSSSFHWNNGFIDNLLSTASARIVDLTCTTLAVTTLQATTWPSFSAVASAGTSVNNITYTKIAFQTELFDTNSDFASNRFTPTAAGKYILTSYVECTTNKVVDQNFRIAVYKNGSAFMENNFQGISSGVGITIIDDANGTTDYYEIFVYHSIGVTVTYGGTSAPYTTFFSGSRIA